MGRILQFISSQANIRLHSVLSLPKHVVISGKRIQLLKDCWLAGGRGRNRERRREGGREGVQCMSIKLSVTRDQTGPDRTVGGADREVEVRDSSGRDVDRTEE